MIKKKEIKHPHPLMPIYSGQTTFIPPYGGDPANAAADYFYEINFVPKPIYRYWCKKCNKFINQV